MRQLWINGKRMDSIHLLRLEFQAARQPGEREALCSQLLTQCNSGALASWLRRQPEPWLPASEQEKQHTMQLKKLLEALEKEQAAGQYAALLAVLCQTGAGEFEACAKTALEESLPKRELLMRQPWWHDEARTLSAVPDADWGNVVLNNLQLFTAMEKHRENRGECTQALLKLYLCNTGEAFLLNLGPEIKNVWFIGCGAPLVRTDPRKRLTEIDMDTQNLYFENFELYCPPGVVLKGQDSRKINFHKHLLGGTKR